MIRYLAQQSLGSMRLLPEGSQRHDSGTIESEGIRMTNKIKNKLSPKLARVAEEVTRRILETVQPQRVLLFGSSVRGDFTKDSDLDVLVIVRGPVHRRQLAQKINRNLHGVGAPVDIVVATEEDIAQYGDKLGTILRPALLEGQVLYAAV
jgi:predicted nucleotidyltransferase